MDEKDTNRKGQVEQEVDRLDDATATLIKKLDDLGTRLQGVCREREPLKVKSEAKQENEGRVLVASALHNFGLRVGDAVDRIDSIMERLEL